MSIISKTITVFAPLVLIAGFATSTPAAADGGHDFIQEAKLFYSAVACADGIDAPAGVPARILAKHCGELREPVKRFRRRYVERAARFLAKRRPKDLPKKVVYPFGGGDLVSALISYPEAIEVTTISLEHAGDPRRLQELQDKDLEDKLTLFRESVIGLLNLHDSTSKNLRNMEAGPLPGQLSFFMLALVATGHEPVSLRFFRIEEDGSLHYYSRQEIEALDDTLAKKKEKRWVDTDYSIAFSNMELRFRAVGQANAPVRVHRHIAANLADEAFKDSPLHKHLTSKGKIAAMTKAASYLLWSKDFSAIRDYLLDNMAFMFSDSTGIPPNFARRRGFEQLTYGTFTGSFLPASQYHNDAFVELWSSQEPRALPFRYGYTDNQNNYHMLITRPIDKSKKSKKRARVRKPATPVAPVAAPAGKKAM